MINCKVLESALEGSRKPEEKFYHKLLDRLKMNPEEVVFLDDFGKNLKPAQKMGFQTIKVKRRWQGIKENFGDIKWVDITKVIFLYSSHWCSTTFSLENYLL